MPKHVPGRPLNHETRKDTRMAYGVGCIWWGTINQVGSVPFKMGGGNHHLPCCPYCGSMLFELPSLAEWWNGVNQMDQHIPGYRKFIEWQQNKCFKGIMEAVEAYNKETDANFYITLGLIAQAREVMKARSKN